MREKFLELAIKAFNTGSSHHLYSCCLVEDELSDKWRLDYSRIFDFTMENKWEFKENERYLMLMNEKEANELRSILLLIAGEYFNN